MKTFKNENGYALLMVLMLILLFTVLGMGLMAMNMNSATQFNTKEEQVKSRHLAEMGVLHYKTEVESIVKNPSIKNSLSCSDFPEVLNEIIESNVSEYTVRLQTDSVCDATDKQMIIKIISEGKAVDESKAKEIEATILISNRSQNENDGETGDDSTALGNVPQKPPYPEEDWVRKSAVTDLDDINSANPSKVIYGITNQNPFIADGFVEVLGAVDVNKKSDWTFKNDLLVAGSFATSTAGKNVSTINIDEDFYIGGALHIKNHTIVNVGSDFIVMGDVDFGTKAIFNISGNALFDWKVSNVEPHADITIQNNAYFKNPLGTVKNNANFCVKGTAFLWKGNKWEPYLSTDDGYEGFNESCLGTSINNPGEKEWEVLPGLNAIYK
ncbi:hypothetical protein [Planomicrobium okeanokoites]|uniref:hypothetical protein n=1 Tax=Planomicrobium okeanokoites TaxID=244 RepID=UPI0009FC239B|nr:hypothetical protein [Planomicrobium okeanokoites]